SQLQLLPLTLTPISPAQARSKHATHRSYESPDLHIHSVGIKPHRPQILPLIHHLSLRPSPNTPQVHSRPPLSVQNDAVLSIDHLEQVANLGPGGGEVEGSGVPCSWEAVRAGYSLGDVCVDADEEGGGVVVRRGERVWKRV
ncbi:hypothetical protein MMC12_008533, partial [Toensbergia leucococca]|nr:hypothetical protein [Toensbergia leucococca]